MGGAIRIHQLCERMVLIVALTFMVSCSGSEYIGQYFSFPPGSEPHKQNWEYIGKVVVYGSSGREVCKLSEKEVNIIIEDKEGHILLSDKLLFNKGCIRASVEWNELEKLTITLVEEGNKHVGDNYNKKLLESGPQQFMELNYNYKSGAKVFER